MNCRSRMPLFSACSRRSSTTIGWNGALQPQLVRPCVPVDADPYLQIRREEADAEERVALHQHQVRSRPRDVVRWFAKKRPSLVVEVRAEELGHVAVHDVELRLVLEHGELALELVRWEAVVGIEKSEKITGGLANRSVSRGSHPSTLLTNAPHGVAVGGGDRSAFVGRPVVDDYQLERRPRLGEDAVDRFSEVWRTVVHTNHHGDACHASASCSRLRSSLAFSERSRGSLSGQEAKLKLSPW